MSLMFFRLPLRLLQLMMRMNLPPSLCHFLWLFPKLSLIWPSPTSNIHQQYHHLWLRLNTQYESAVHRTTLMSFISLQLLQKNAVSLHTTLILMQLARMWIWDEAHMMAQICHYVMVHTATKQYMDAMTSSKKQYGLKAGLHWFTDRRSKAVMKELTQFHTLNCFCPWTLQHSLIPTETMLLLPSCS